MSLVNAAVYLINNKNYVGCHVFDLWNMLNACEKGVYTNSVDPDETPQNAAFYQGLCCLPR